MAISPRRDQLDFIGLLMEETQSTAALASPAAQGVDVLAGTATRSCARDRTGVTVSWTRFPVRWGGREDPDG